MRPTVREQADCTLVRTMRFGTSEHGQVAIELNGTAYEFHDVLVAKEFIKRLQSLVFDVERTAEREEGGE